jgi:ketosteroid isomerase-like protein
MKSQSAQTLQVLRQFNDAFMRHDGSMLEPLIADDCVMESVEPAPNGTRYEGRDACLTFWQKLANSRDGAFTAEDIIGIEDRGIILWRYHFGPERSQSVRGVNVMRVRDGLIVEALGYVKTGAAPVADAVRSATS